MRPEFARLGPARLLAGPRQQSRRGRPSTRRGLGTTLELDFNRQACAETRAPGTIAELSAELIGVLGVGASLASLILVAALRIGGWPRDSDRGLAPLEGLIEGAGLFRPVAGPSSPSCAS